MSILVYCLFIAAASASSLGSPVQRRQRIVDGELTTIDRYPSAVTLLIYNCFTNVYSQECGSVIINKRSVLTAAHCVSHYLPAYYYELRVGSSYASSGGAVHIASKVLLHPDFNHRTKQNDVGILYSITEFEFNKNVAPGSLAPKGYLLGDNERVWAVGWGISNLTDNSGSEQLQEVQVYTINWEKCRERYQEMDTVVYEDMLCTGIWNVGGKDQCNGDSGSPLYHNNVVVGLCSWGAECGSERFPGVNVLVSLFADWISAN